MLEPVRRLVAYKFFSLTKQATNTRVKANVLAWIREAPHHKKRMQSGRSRMRPIILASEKTPQEILGMPVRDCGGRSAAGPDSGPGNQPRAFEHIGRLTQGKLVIRRIGLAGRSRYTLARVEYRC